MSDNDFTPGDVEEGPRSLPQREAGAALPPEQRAELIVIREAKRVAREGKDGAR